MIVAWIFVLSVVCSVSADLPTKYPDYFVKCIDDAEEETQSQVPQGTKCDESVNVVNCLKGYMKIYPDVKTEIYVVKTILYFGCWPYPEEIYGNCVDDAKKKMESPEYQKKMESPEYQGIEDLEYCDESVYVADCLEGYVKKYPRIADVIREDVKEGAGGCWPYPSVILEKCGELMGIEFDCDGSRYIINCLNGYLKNYPGIAYAIEDEKDFMPECWP